MRSKRTAAKHWGAASRCHTYITEWDGTPGHSFDSSGTRTTNCEFDIFGVTSTQSPWSLHFGTGGMVETETLYEKRWGGIRNLPDAQDVEMEEEVPTPEASPKPDPDPQKMYPIPFDDDPKGTFYVYFLYIGATNGHDTPFGFFGHAWAGGFKVKLGDRGSVIYALAIDASNSMDSFDSYNMECVELWEYDFGPASWIGETSSPNNNHTQLNKSSGGLNTVVGQSRIKQFSGKFGEAPSKGFHFDCYSAINDVKMVSKWKYDNSKMRAYDLYRQCPQPSYNPLDDNIEDDSVGNCVAAARSVWNAGMYEEDKYSNNGPEPADLRQQIVESK